jgi:hypothetical protein
MIDIKYKRVSSIRSLNFYYFFQRMLCYFLAISEMYHQDGNIFLFELYIAII